MKSLGQIAYEAYGATTLLITGADMPSWDEITLPHVKAAWEAAALAVRNAISNKFIDALVSIEVP